MASKRERTRADGSVAYIALFRHGGRQTSITFDTVRARDKFVRDIDRHGIETALAILDAQDDTSADVPTLAELAEEHIDAVRASDSTKRRYRSYVRNDFGSLARLPVDAITADMVEKCVARLEREGAAPKTVHNKHGFLYGVMSRAVRKHYVTENPCEHTDLPQVRKPKTDFLDDDEFARFLAYVPQRWHALVTLLFATGMRWSEATALQVQHVDLTHGRINVDQAWRLNDAGWEVDLTKTEKSDRVVTISRPVIDILTPLVDNRQPSAFVFTNSRGGPVRHNSFHETVWQPAVALANGEDPWPNRKRATKHTSQWHGIRPAERPLGKRPKIHAMRHSAGTNMLAMGIDLKTVQEQLGHESIMTTADVYGHVTMGQRLAIAAAQERMLANAFPAIEDEPAQIEA